MHHRGAIVTILYCMNQTEEIFADVRHLQRLWFLIDSPLKRSIPHKLCDNVQLVFLRIVYYFEELKYILMVLKRYKLCHSYHLPENCDFIVNEVVRFFVIKINFPALFFLINYFHSIFLTISFTYAAVNLRKSAPIQV
jgi:hypothetical protein